MVRKSLVMAVIGMMILFCTSISSADVPSMINYQGKLTTASGGCLNDTVQMTFSIYPDTLGSPADWTETQTEVEVKEGIFNVLLGSVVIIPPAVFDGNVKYLGVQVESDSEMRPLKPMVSVAYAYRAGEVDGGGVNCEDCDDRFVNVQGPDSVVATAGPAFLGKAMGSGYLTGIKGYANSNSSNAHGVSGEGYGSDDPATYGVLGYAQNTSTGGAFGGYFWADSSGTGPHFGVFGEAFASSGPAYALSGMAFSSLEDAFGTWSEAINNSSGDAYGGFFDATGSGSGNYYGVYSMVYATTPDFVQGVKSWGSNLSTGSAYGGTFFVDQFGTGTHYGSVSHSEGNSSSSTYGCYGYAKNYSSGTVYAGYFKAPTTSGSGTKYGVYASAPADPGWAGYFEGDVRITGGLVVLGAKSAGVKVDNGEYRLLYSQESPEAWFEDFGEGQLVNGRAHIDLDPLFLETVTLNSQHPMKVFIQLTSGEPMNVVVHKGTAGFDVVAEDIGGDATFDYRVVAKRKGFENVRLAKVGGPTPEEVAAEQERHLAELEEERARMEQERMEMERKADLR